VGSEKKLPGLDQQLHAKCSVFSLRFGTEHDQSLVNCFNQRRMALYEGGSLPYRVLLRRCILITDFVSKNQSTHSVFSTTVAILRYDVIFSPRHQCGEYSVATYNFLSYNFIFRKQFYLIAFDLKIIGYGNTDNNLESRCILKHGITASYHNIPITLFALFPPRGARN
jgi:hypothetical protein